MARRIHSSKLENRTARLKLDSKTKPYFQMIAPRIHLGYRRNQDGPGSWSVKAHGSLHRFAVADDREDANNDTIMDYWQALDRAKQLARVGEGSKALITAREAVEDYEAELKLQGGAKYNATTLLRRHLPEPFASKVVALLKKRDLTEWRAGMLKKNLDPVSVDRYAKSLRSALNLTASNHEGISNAKAWKEGLRITATNGDDEDEAVRDNFILPDQTITALVRGCHEDEQDDDFDLLIDVAAETGSRESQIWRLKVRSLQDADTETPYLLMPTSRKGSNRNKRRASEVRPLPISPRLAALLRQRAKGRAAHEPLLHKVHKVADRFRVVVKRLGLDETLTPYCLRHSSIVRALLRNLPHRLVAAGHDTSVAVLEKVYSRFIVSRHTDALMRAALLDHDPATPADNIVQFARAAE
jgi:hypothetical protein